MPAAVRLESLRVSADLDTSKYVQGANAKVAADGAMVDSAKAVDSAVQTTETRLTQSATALDRVTRAVDPAAAANAKLAQAQSTLQRGLEQGRITQERYNELLVLTQQRYVGQGRALNDNVAGLSRYRSGIQQAGYQVGDFAVQVASGQNGLVAFTQQASQLLQVFGPYGAVAGAALAITGALGVAFLRTGESAGDTKKATQEYGQALETVNSIMLSSEDASRAKALSDRDEAAGVLLKKKALDDEAASLKASTAARLANVAAQDTSHTRLTTRSLGRTATAGFGGPAPDQASADTAAAKARGDLVAANEAAGELQDKIDALQSGVDVNQIFKDNDKLYAFRDGLQDALNLAKATTSEDKVQVEMAKARRDYAASLTPELDKQLESILRQTQAVKDAAEADKDRLKFTQAIIDELDSDREKQAANDNKRNQAVEKYIDGLESTATLEQQSGVEKDIQRATIEAQNKLFDEQGVKLRDLSDIEKDRISTAVRLKDAADQQQKANDQAVKENERAAKRATDSITDYAADTIFDRLTGRAQSLWESFKDFAFRAIADIAAQALIRPIVVPIINSIIGTGGAAAGGVAGSGSSGGLGGLLNGGSSLFSLGDKAGLFGNTFSGIGSGITGAIDSFGTSLGFAGALPGAGGLGGLGMTGALVDVPVADGAYLGLSTSAGGSFGGATLSSFLGGAGLGFGAGTLLNSLVGGKSTGGTIGSGAGALAGAAIGSIIPGVGTILGGLIGGAGGGLLGGLIGPGKGFSGGQINLATNSSGDLIRTNSGFKKGDQAGAEQFADQFLGQINGLFDQLGLKFSGKGNFARLNFGDGAQSVESSLGEILAHGGIQSGDASLDKMIAGLDRSGSADDITARLSRLVTTFKALDALNGTAAGQPVDPLADTLGQINDQFNSLRSSAQEFGLALGKLDEAQAAAVKQAEDSYRATVAQPYLAASGGIVDFLNSQALSATATGSPQDRLNEAQRQYDDLLGRAQTDPTLSGTLTQSAGTLLSLGRDTLASTPAYASLESSVKSGLLAIADKFSSDGFIDAQVEATRQQTQQQVAAINTVNDSIQLLRREIALLTAKIGT
ncbi:MAG TPA: hypothetical protein VGO34_14930 [Alphaproteobacteria bacterium]|jgi:hypothetical protein